MKLGRPPPVLRLRDITPEIRVLDPGTSLVRLYFRGGDHSTTWCSFRKVGPQNGRFHHHIPHRPHTRKIRLPVSQRGILYAALNGLTCLAEVYQDTRIINRRYKMPWMAIFKLAAPLQLLDLSGRWPTRTGKASAAIATGRRDYAQEWSRAFYEAYPEIHGLLYRSSMDPRGYCIALYERAENAGALSQCPDFNRSLEDACWEPILQEAIEEIGYELV